ncbi:hypothetical protein DV735_g5195, partial [Chaetothyriales sp. CBS 134920]
MPAKKKVKSFSASGRRRSQTKTRKLSTRQFGTASPSSPFVVLTLKSKRAELARIGKTPTDLALELTEQQNRRLQEDLSAEVTQIARTPAAAAAVQTAHSAHSARGAAAAEMQTRGAWSKNRANPANRLPEPATPAPKKALGSPASAAPGPASGVKPLKRGPERGASSLARPKAKRRKPNQHVTFDDQVEIIHHIPFYEDSDLNAGEEHRSPARGKANRRRQEEETSDMADSDRPKLKLKMSGLGGAGATPAVQPVHTPVPQSATQRLKLSFSRPPSTIGGTVTQKANSPAGVTDGGSAGKKRKRPSAGAGATSADASAERAKSKPPTGPRKITLKTSTSMPNKPGPAAVSTPGSVLTPHVKFHIKGKIPLRKLGVGYDSENDETERDPVILEGFILRMLPGPDRDYIQQSIENGTIGLSKVQGGASIILRMLDTHGRRGILQVRDHKYATTMVDLPCLIEGIKSWDKKAWIKSIDICQMVLVLGPCRNDDEARNFPLPEGVDPKTYAYAHGITPPMWSVRKRRFDKTKRARVDDIEAVERKVNALLNDDARAVDSSWEIVEGDPDEMERSDGEQYSGTEDEDEDAAGEHDDYFGRPGPYVGTPGEIDVDAEGEVEEDEDLAAEFARALEEGDGQAAAGLSAHIDAGGDNNSSVATTTPAADYASPSASANVTQVDTPASGVADENLRQAKERIAELTAKIKEQKLVLVKTPNLILKRKIAAKIQELEKDRRMMKAMAGAGDDDDDEDDAAGGR